MRWFTGTIPEAITKAKSQKTLFVVFVFDTSELSDSIFTALDSPEVDKVFTAQEFVAIKLENGQQTAQQFAQIYPLIVVPSLFFINSESGQPLEVVAGSVTPESLLERIAKLPLKSQVSSEAEHTPEKQNDNNTKKDDVNISASTSIANQGACRDEAAASSSNQVDSDEDIATTSKRESSSPEKKLEDKVEYAKEQLAKKQREKELELRELEKQKEKDRRKMGQEVIKSKQKRDQEEAIAAAKSYRKEKKEDIIAREEIKRRIQADREEREARAAMFSPQASTSTESSKTVKQEVAPSTSNMKVARIKFRLPDGSSLLNQFPDDAPLQEVQQYVRDHCSLTSFIMTSTIHQRPFSTEDMASSLRDLGLVPSAIIIVSPISRREGTISTSSGSIMSFVWFLLTPFTVLFSFVQRLVGFGAPPPPPPPQASEPENNQPTSGSATTRNRPKTAYGNRGRSSTSRQEGNIYRFQNQDDNDDDDDEEKKTWNGNSTQQM